jgi:tellurite methyltransferase
MADWNERYRRGEHIDDEPHPIVAHFASRLTPAKALDIASGVGRHAIWLAERRWRVTAVDYSSVAIDILNQRAADKRLTVETYVADLEQQQFAIEPQSYDLIVLCNYLQRDLFPAIREGTRVGGIVIAVIAMVDDDPNVKPMNPAFLVDPGELRKEFEGWELIWYFEGKSGKEPRRATAELVGRRLS